MSARPIVEENEKRLKLLAFFASQIAWEMEDNLTRLLSMKPSNATAKNQREIALVQKILGRNTNTQPIIPAEREIIDYIEDATFNSLDRALRPPPACSEALHTCLKRYQEHRRLHLTNKMGEIGLPTLTGLICAAAFAFLALSILCPAVPLGLGIAIGIFFGVMGLTATPVLAWIYSPCFKNKARDHKETADGLTHAPKMLHKQKRTTATIAKTGNKIRKNRERFFKATNSTDSNAADLSVFTRIKYRGLQNRPPTQSINMPEMPATTAGPDLCFEA